MNFGVARIAGAILSSLPGLLVVWESNPAINRWAILMLPLRGARTVSFFSSPTFDYTGILNSGR
jgi:hypothetical protein